MIENLITFDTAKLAKEKGFDIPIQHTVNNINQLYDIYNEEININSSVVDNWNKFDSVISAPTQSLLQKWLREKHNISVLIEHGRLENESFGYFPRVFTEINKSSKMFKVFAYSNNYEEALEKGLQEALKLIKNE